MIFCGFISFAKKVGNSGWNFCSQLGCLRKQLINPLLNPQMVFCHQNCSDLHTVRKNCSSDQEKLLKFEAEGRELAKFLRSLEQFIQTVKGQNNVW